MSPEATAEFARELMMHVWIPFADERLEDFYHPDVVGHHGEVRLTLADVRNRLAWDRASIDDPVYDIQDVIAEEDAFSIRFVYTAKLRKTGEPLHCGVAYFYHLREGRISEFWLFCDLVFDYKEKPSL